MSTGISKAQVVLGLQALPSWAQKTLEKHASDARHEKSLEQLEQGKTGDALWDAAQQQLASTGLPCCITQENMDSACIASKQILYALDMARSAVSSDDCCLQSSLPGC